MNKEQQIPEDQQATKSAMEHTKEQECVHTAQKYIEICLIPRPHCPHMTRQNYIWKTRMIQVQGKNQPNQ